MDLRAGFGHSGEGAGIVRIRDGGAREPAMRPPRARITLRSMMVVMAVPAAVLRVAERQLRFRRLTEFHASRSQADLIGCVMLVTDDGKPTALVESATGTPTAPTRRDWHRALRDKHERAAPSPRVSVASDPPGPE